YMYIVNFTDRIRESLNEIYLMSNVVVSELLTKIREHMGCLYKLAEAVSSLDFLVSLAHQCTMSTYVRPEFTDTTAIKNGHHPILEKIQLDSPVPNNTFISKNNNFLVITGPNMSGKSTYLKQVALLQIMAQIGCFVPAEYASFRITRQIFSRIGSNDDIESNCSTFMLEMREINYIIQNADDSSLIIIDELGRGTSVEEGIGLCYSICEYLVNKKAFTLFATHFMELTSLDVTYPNVSNYQFEVKHDENGMKVHFTHALSRGHTSEEHYGLKLAELSCLPYSVTTEARVLSQQIQLQRQTACQESPEAVRLRCVFRLAINLQQVASNFRMDVGTLKTYLTSLREQYEQKLRPYREE
ncbi:mutS protein homolog 4-like, partial [Limulus polyphemus]|uniref:MutS protein homolog 4-like n=1 Tax=Limulus polyphemus TaxID=6850 RepID=A0ABM1TM68_LIMPO